MHLPPLAILLAWIPFGAYLFRRYPACVAVLLNFFGGWAILPGAAYIPSPSDFPYWILGDSLPTSYFLTKATVPSLAALLGFAFFYSGDWRRFRPGLCDLPMVLWCCVPLLSGATHWNTFREGLFGAAYQTLAWGVPWLLGRMYFADQDSMLLAAKASIAAGLCYIPICLVEIVTGPQLYALLYGYEPYRWVGAQRYIGYRPIGLLEDGNQLGIWMALATLLAVSLCVRKLATHIFGLPLAWVAAGLAVTTLLCQSAGSIVLLLLLLPLALASWRSTLRISIAAMVLAIVTFALLLMLNHATLRALAENNPLFHAIASGLQQIGRHSLVWRIARDDSHMAVALQRPILGQGRWDWWQGGNARPWGLWMLVFGMYGLVGLAALGSILFLPLLRLAWPAGEDRNRIHPSLRPVLAALILIVAFDGLMNSALILPYLLILGGIVAPLAGSYLINGATLKTPRLRPAIKAGLRSSTDASKAHMR